MAGAMHAATSDAHAVHDVILRAVRASEAAVESIRVSFVVVRAHYF
jgi:hypothetical protein